MFHDPVEESFFESDVVAGFFALDPLVAQNLFTLGKEFLVEQGLAYEFGRFIYRRAHCYEHNFWNFQRSSIVLPEGNT